MTRSIPAQKGAIEAKELPLHYREIATLPSDWDICLLQDVLTSISNGLTAPQSADQDGIPVTRIETIASDRVDPQRVRYIKNLDRTTLERYRLRTGDILLSHINSEPQIGRAVLYSGNPPTLLHGMNLLRLQVDARRCDPEFLVYLFKLYRSLGVFRGLATRAVGQSSINQGRLKAVAIPLPPVEEQRAIARLLRAVDTSIEAAEEVIEATRQLKRSLARHLFKYGPMPPAESDRGELQETGIGQIPEHWSLMLFRDILSEPLRNGHSARRASSGDGVRTLTLSAVTNDDFSLANTKVTEADPDRVRDLWLRQGDILIERANTRELVGTAALYEGPEKFAIYPDLVIRARVQEPVVNPKFVVEFLRTQVARAYFQRNSRGAAGNMPKIGHGIIETLSLPVPSLDEQRVIAQILTSVDLKAKAEILRREALSQLFRSLISEIMSGQRRVGQLEKINA